MTPIATLRYTCYHHGVQITEHKIESNIMRNLSKEEFSLLGLQQAGYSIESIQKSSRAKNNKRLKDYCYATTNTISSIFLDIQDPLLDKFCISKPNPSHLISALYFLKKYPTICELAARCSIGTEKTMMNQV